MVSLNTKAYNNSTIDTKTVSLKTFNSNSFSTKGFNKNFECSILSWNLKAQTF